MNTHFIFNADDFGPIDFINQGVYKLVKKGVINSVQVIVNGDSDARLTEKLIELHNAVPDGKLVDLGIHLTLSSGGPMTPFNATEDEKAAHWKTMVTWHKGKVVFKDFKKFSFRYDELLSEIEEELRQQKLKLARIMTAIHARVDENGNLYPKKIALTTASHHHNLSTISTVFFELYKRVVEEEPVPLAVRSPKLLPELKARTYYAFAIPFLNFSDRRYQRKEMRDLTKLFLKNKYFRETVEIQTSNYTDIQFYKSLGSISIKDFTKGRKMTRLLNSLQQQFNEMMQRANQYAPNPAAEHPTKKVAEFVFHLGSYNENNPERDFERLTDNYIGITHKYFDNRIAEAAVLEAFARSEFATELNPKLISWAECERVKFIGSR